MTSIAPLFITLAFEAALVSCHVVDDRGPSFARSVLPQALTSTTGIKHPLRILDPRNAIDPAIVHRPSGRFAMVAVDPLTGTVTTNPTFPDAPRATPPPTCVGELSSE